MGIGLVIRRGSSIDRPQTVLKRVVSNRDKVFCKKGVRTLFGALESNEEFLPGQDMVSMARYTDGGMAREGNANTANKVSDPVLVTTVAEDREAYCYR
jgi:hypothetical protein